MCRLRSVDRRLGPARIRERHVVELDAGFERRRQRRARLAGTGTSGSIARNEK